MIIKFANNTAFEYLTAIETEERYNGSSRRTLTFECAVGVIGIDVLNTLLSNEANTATIQLTNEKENITHIYDGYVLKLKVGVESKLVQAETPDTPAIYEDRLVFKLGTRTFIENQLIKMGLKTA